LNYRSWGKIDFVSIPNKLEYRDPYKFELLKK